MFEVLLVEDDGMLRKTIRDMLTEEFSSLEVTEAATGDEAVEQVRRRRPGLIFMDIRLPGKTGLGAMKEIKNLYPHVPVVILTSYDFPEYREAAFQYGAEQFLVKGTTGRELILSLVAAKLAGDGEYRKELVSNCDTDSETAEGIETTTAKTKTGASERTKDETVLSSNEPMRISGDSVEVRNPVKEALAENRADSLKMSNPLCISKR